MNRRTFFGTLGGIGMMAAPGPSATATGKGSGIYVLDSYLLQQGSQVMRAHEYLGKLALPALNKAQHQGPKIFLEALVAPHMPQVAAIYGFESMDELGSVHRKIGEDAETTAAFEKWDNAEPWFDSSSSTLLQAADYSPPVAALAEAPKTPRIFELRVYHSPTWRQLKALHERFAGPEIQIFHRVGIHPILYTSTLFGANMPNLTYLIPFENLAAREKAWDAFGADPEWLKVRKESIEKHGQISSIIQISLFKSTAYSPIR